MTMFVQILAALVISLNAHATDSLAIGTLGYGPPAPSRWFKNNIFLIDRDRRTGYALYRMSKPDAEDMRLLCALGVKEMMVLSGTAAKHEIKYQKECPSLKVIYNVKQDEKIPLSRRFLRHFDDWVQDAHAKGRKIAFRCECGCHRTGRLAAYYQIKYQGLSLEDAKVIMTDHGKWMAFFPFIYKQVDALFDFIRASPCSTKLRYCVRD
jgi:protein-tyrosine phosphatase